MNTKSKITLIAAVLTSLAAPAFATAVVPEFPGELAQPTAATEAQQSYASTRIQRAPARNWTPVQTWTEQRTFDRNSGVIN